jgi:DNA-binding HxlR family transcriptional regulator
MTESRYDLRCPVARALKIIGERWTILILRDLFRDGPRRFQDFQSSMPGISPNTLSTRLKSLDEHGIIERRFYDDHPPRAEYRLTKKGRTLGPILKALLEWGRKYTQCCATFLQPSGVRSVAVVPKTASANCVARVSSRDRDGNLSRTKRRTMPD